MDPLTVVSFLFFTGLVAVLTWRLTRGRLGDDETGYFLAGRSLTGVFIAGSLLLTNLSTEQLVGLNGGAFADGLVVMAWEVIAAISLVVLALFFLPRYLKSGIATVPQFLEERYGSGTRSLTTFIFIVAYMLILLPFVLFLGAKGLDGMLGLQDALGLGEVGTIYAVVIFIGVVGSAYAIFGGLRAVAVSDTFNGVGLLVGGLMITVLALRAAAGDGSIGEVISELRESKPEALSSLGGPGNALHWPTLFTGVLLLNFFYWTTNQQIIQRTFGAKNLAEGQKGVLLASFFKVLAPLILVVPGILAFHIFQKDPDIDVTTIDQGGVYGMLVNRVLPAPLTGFFAAVVMGSILSTFNSVLNSSATLFSLGVYQKMIKPDASHHEIVRSGRVCSAIVMVGAVAFGPLVFLRVEGLFNHFQSLNGIYFIPLLAIVLFGFFNRTASGTTAIITIVAGLLAMILGTFVFNDAISAAWGPPGGFHFMGVVFAGLLILQLVLGRFMKRPEPYVQQDARAVDLTPWKYAKPTGLGLVILVLIIYALFAG
ncbi:MAG: solute:sodium symporter family transporter [Akkermansiaceae bacterium]|nr:solute:sodium symporter family transporter [Akkermansiaceae bacterium]NNM31080.1 solute:sodium symporter family transporter [Akkermansiaceae bacterium]